MKKGDISKNDVLTNPQDLLTVQTNIDATFGIGSYKRLYSQEQTPTGNVDRVEIEGDVYDFYEISKTETGERTIFFEGQRYRGIVKELKNGKRISFLLPKMGTSFVDLAISGTNLELAIVDGRFSEGEQPEDIQGNKKFTVFLADVMNMSQNDFLGDSNWIKTGVKTFNLLRQKSTELLKLKNSQGIFVVIFDSTINNPEISKQRVSVLRYIRNFTVPVKNLIEVHEDIKEAFEKVKTVVLATQI